MNNDPRCPVGHLSVVHPRTPFSERPPELRDSKDQAAPATRRPKSRTPAPWHLDHRARTLLRGSPRMPADRSPGDPPAISRSPGYLPSGSALDTVPPRCMSWRPEVGPKKRRWSLITWNVLRSLALLRSRVPTDSTSKSIPCGACQSSARPSLRRHP